MRRRNVNVDAVLAWAVVVEIVFGILFLLAGCSPQQKEGSTYNVDSIRKAHKKMLIEKRAAEESRLKTKQDSNRFYEDGF